jgi:hypothetical protein
MAKRFLLALVILLVGALLSTLIAIVATNGYGTAGINETLLAVGYFVLGAGGVLFLAWLAAVLSGRLSARLGWRTWITLPLLLLPALLIELFALPLLAIMLAELG